MKMSLISNGISVLIYAQINYAFSVEPFQTIKEQITQLFE